MVFVYHGTADCHVKAALSDLFPRNLGSSFEEVPAQGNLSRRYQRLALAAFSTMLIPLKRLFCCLALHAWCAGQLARSSPNFDGHVAQEFAGMLQSDHSPETEVVHMVRGMSLEEWDANKAEIESIKNDRQDIALRLELLNPGGEPELIAIKSQLEQLHDALRTPILEKLFRLNGLGSSMTSLQPGSKIAPEPRPSAIRRQLRRLYHALLSPVSKRERRLDSQGPLKSNNERSKPSSTTEEPSKLAINSRDSATTSTSTSGNERVPRTPGQKESPPRSGILNPLLKRLKLYIKKLAAYLKRLSTSMASHKSDTAESKEYLLGGRSPKSSVDSILNSDGLAKVKPVEASTGTKYSQSENHERERGTTSTELQETELQETELHGDVLDLVREYMIRKDIKIWHALKEALVALPSQSLDRLDEFSGSSFRRGFLECSYLIESFIHKYELLPPHLMGDVNLFEKTTVFRMIEYHIRLLFKRYGDGFFGIAESIIPQLDFLLTGRAMKHFQPSIKALCAADQRNAVYLVLINIMRRAPWPRNQEQDLLPSDRFREIRTIFIQQSFIDQANSLSAALSSTQSQGHLGQAEYLTLVLLVNDVIDFFQDLSLLGRTQEDRLEFLVVYYISDFLDEFYRPIVAAILRSKERPELFDKQLKFMRGNLKFYRNRFEDPNYPDKKQDMTFFETYLRSSREDRRLRAWIDRVTDKLFRQNLPHLHPMSSPIFNLWMGRECWYCRSPLTKFHNCWGY
ncbi:hypothetical protein PSTG_15563 [Puccinia striiformis f. sp. tritici PST-78]|uniref:Uncharacterized protein n=1 Tax=Puccinia striiformis f. sp. tritici PST-78 TaxID=1165861 RepID=A0A0L0UVE0_9BASI|nr:hypothetical protein PSTG_15563 [Puccinia striiformis f. sp. tritici PST-78]